MAVIFIIHSSIHAILSLSPMYHLQNAFLLTLRTYKNPQSYSLYNNKQCFLTEAGTRECLVFILRKLLKPLNDYC